MLRSTNCNSEAYLQFNNDLILLEPGETLIDGGAFTGDSTLEFIKAAARENVWYRKIICFEPDPKTYEQLKQNTARFEKVKRMPFGLWSHASTLCFADSSIMKAGSTKILTEGDEVAPSPGTGAGITEIRTTSIDLECSNEPVTLIKMDIEGAEIEALHGAVQTITRCRPRLIVSVYHKRNDLLEIPLLIHQMMPSYKLYLRHFSNNFTETTLFAIP